MAIVEIKNLTVSRGGREVIKNFSANLNKGTITAIVGPNGSGKSTLLAALAGDIPVNGGSVRFNNKDLKSLNLAELAKIRSVVMQNRNYWLSYSTREAISMGQDESAISRIDWILEALNMKSYAEQSVTTLSGGQAQRVEIARALIRETDLYFLDEPLASQDAQSKKRVIEVLKNLRADGKTILVIAHTEPSSLSWCDQVIDNFS